MAETYFANNAALSNCPAEYRGQYYHTSPLVISPEVVSALYSPNLQIALLVMHQLVCAHQNPSKLISEFALPVITAEKEDFLVHLTFGIYISQADFCLFQIYSRFVKIMLTDE